MSGPVGTHRDPKLHVLTVAIGSLPDGECLQALCLLTLNLFFALKLNYGREAPTDALLLLER